MSEILRVERLAKSFGGVTVAAELSFALQQGERVALIGPNGAGKTTFVNLVAGALAPSSGRVFLAGEDVTAEPDLRRVRRGLVRSFQISRLFADMTPREHVALAVLQRERQTGKVLRSAWRVGTAAAEAEALLAELGLAELGGRPVREIAYGQQRLLEIAIALALKPRLLLLDEPAAGVPQADAARIFRAIDRLPGDLAVLLVEHDMDLVFRFARRVLVLAAGRIICDGAPADVAADPTVRTAYLGSYAHAGRRA
jgi:branched-chain amino acid transport system ATP-binding protein